MLFQPHNSRVSQLSAFARVLLSSCEISTKLALVALAFSSLDVYCTSGVLGNSPLSGIQASIREAALYTERSLGCGVQRLDLKYSAIQQELQTPEATMSLFVKQG